MFAHILLATDGSAASTHAAALAVGLARLHESRLTVVYVVDPYPYLGIGDTNPMGFQAYMSAAYAHVSQAHASVAALCDTSEKPVTAQMRTVEDVPAAQGILQTAKEVKADLVVVGSHGRGGISRMLLGSVASKVVAQSPVPVLVAR